MTVIVQVDLPGITQQQYDAIRAEAGWLEQAPTGGVAHLTWFDADGCHNLDAWESESAFGAFGEQRLGPAMAKLGIEVPVNPVFHQAHEVYLPQAGTILATTA